MPRIYLETIVRSDLETCFDLSRSIDFHKVSMEHTKEVPVAGRMSGLIEAGEFVEWEATHFFVRQRLSSRITEMVKPNYFVDEMVKGAFKSFVHKHKFLRHKAEEVLIIDDFQYEAPFGILGTVANALFLKMYVEKMIRSRNEQIKSTLESGNWKKFLGSHGNHRNNR
jgi:ligand-binding SRPBCC domain-containing protein